MDSIHPYCAVFGSVEGTREEVHNAVGLFQRVSTVMLDYSK